MGGNKSQVKLVEFVSLENRGIEPMRKHQGDAGYDLSISEDRLLPPNGITHLRTHICLSPPMDMWFHLVGRSSNIDKGIYVMPAIIDSGYRGELFIMVQNLLGIKIGVCRGARLAQLIPHTVQNLVWDEVKMTTNTTRGTDGFGSTGQ